MAIYKNFEQVIIYLAMENVSRKSIIKDHVLECIVYDNSDSFLKQIQFLKCVNLEYDTNTHEALLIIKHIPRLNRQLFSKGSFLLAYACFDCMVNNCTPCNTSLLIIILLALVFLTVVVIRI